MAADNPEKKNSLPTEPPFADENGVPVKADPMKEQDMDELSHASLPEMPDPIEEVDADDVVHKIKPETPPAMDSEKDPDDLVHGN